MEQFEKYIWLVLAWAAYFSMHSLLASEKIKSVLKRQGFSSQVQRIVYNLLSAIGLLAVLFLNGAINSEYLYEKTKLLQIVAMFTAAAGVLIINAAFKQYKVKSFIGLQEEEATLNTSGILQLVRHPIYTGTILIVVGFVIYDPRIASLVSAICIFTYLPIGIYFEEQKLLKQYGDRYQKYKEEVPSVFPNLFTLLKKIS